MHSAGPDHVHSWDAIKSQQSDPWVMDERRRRRKREEEGASLLKDPLNRLHRAASLPSALTHYKPKVSGALSGVVLTHSLSFSSQSYFCAAFMNLFPVTTSAQ